MKIKRFNEDEQVDISSDRIEEILTEVKDMATALDDKSKLVESLLGELGNFKSQSKKGNDQIDDSILSLQVIKKGLTDCIDKLDNINSNLNDYNDKGRNYLYSEG